MLTPEEIHFILDNETADTTRLLLGKRRSEHIGIQLPLCVKCIEARRKIKEKIPIWYTRAELVYPFPLSVEQCSSQATALYKQELVVQLARRFQLFANNKLNNASSFTTADLTGGMGVDSYFLSRIAQNHYYIERNPELCAAATWNFQKLEAHNIILLNTNCNIENRELFSFLSTKNLLLSYIDPARRSKTNSKIITLQDYEPNLLELKEEILKLSPLLLVKVSPMADIRQTLQLLPETIQIHVVSVNNECKELLFLLASPCWKESEALGQTSANAPVITAVDLLTENTFAVENSLLTKNTSVASNIRTLFHFTLQEEEQACAAFTTHIRAYLYEPKKSILKSGAYKLVAQRSGLEKLAPSTHLYTSDQLSSNFPGKTYPVLRSINFNKKALREIAKEFPCADISARNFPLDTNELKKLSGIRDGGDHHLFAVTLANGDKKIIICKKAIK